MNVQQIYLDELIHIFSGHDMNYRCVAHLIGRYSGYYKFGLMISITKWPMFNDSSVQKLSIMLPVILKKTPLYLWQDIVTRNCEVGGS